MRKQLHKICNKSDLALESVEKTVPEIFHWKTDICAVTTHFRTSKSRTKKLREISDEVLVFPAMFEVRFAEHLLATIKAILNPRGAGDCECLKFFTKGQL